jgi:hypothetical protein
MIGKSPRRAMTEKHLPFDEQVKTMRSDEQ